MLVFVSHCDEIIYEIMIDRSAMCFNAGPQGGREGRDLSIIANCVRSVRSKSSHVSVDKSSKKIFSKMDQTPGSTR